MLNDTSRLIFIISAPSGAGKTTLIHRVMARDPYLAFSISHTTRPMRDGEIDGRDYYFITRDEFQGLISEGAFVEWANVYGELYGTTKREIDRLHRLGKDVVLDIDIQGAMQVMKKVDRQKWVSIFILPPDMDTLKQRLISRGKDPADHIERRLSEARKEILQAKKYDFQVINDNLQSTVDELISIIEMERTKRKLN